MELILSILNISTLVFRKILNRCTQYIELPFIICGGFSKFYDKILLVLYTQIEI